MLVYQRVTIVYHSYRGYLPTHGGLLDNHVLRQRTTEDHQPSTIAMDGIPTILGLSLRPKFQGISPTKYGRKYGTNVPPLEFNELV